MWCGCRRAGKSLATQSFSVMDEDAAVSEMATANLQGSDLSRIMGLKPVKNATVQGVTLDGETVLFDVATGRSYRLNALGTAVWELCTGNASLHVIHHSVATRLALPVEHAHAHVMACVLQWSHDGLLNTATVSR
jgi:hypothetical protein